MSNLRAVNDWVHKAGTKQFDTWSTRDIAGLVRDGIAAYNSKPTEEQPCNNQCKADTDKIYLWIEKLERVVDQLRSSSYSTCGGPNPKDRIDALREVIAGLRDEAYRAKTAARSNAALCLLDKQTAELSKCHKPKIKLEAGCRIRKDGDEGTVLYICGDYLLWSACGSLWPWVSAVDMPTVVEAATPEVGDTVRHEDGEVGIIHLCPADDEGWVNIKFAGDSKTWLWNCRRDTFTILHKAKP